MIEDRIALLEEDIIKKKTQSANLYFSIAIEQKLDLCAQYQALNIEISDLEQDLNSAVLWLHQNKLRNSKL